MSVAVEDVKCWLVLRGIGAPIGHVVQFVKHGWFFTLCQVWTPNGKETTSRPPRVCSTCRERLKIARPIT